MHHNMNQEISLFVGDLPHDCSDEKLQRLFQSKFKSVRRVQIIRNEDGSSRGFGFVRFDDRADFQAALSQEMKIGNTTLRLDTAHRHAKGNARNRYNSYNSSGSNNSNHHFNNNNNLHPHHHHHNQPHHHHHQNQSQSQQQHQQQQQHHQQQQQQQPPPPQPQSQQTQPHGSHAQPHHHQSSQQGQGQSGHPHHGTHSNHNFYSSSQQKINHQVPDNNNKNSKPQTGLPLGGDEANQLSQPNPPSQQPSTRPSPSSQTQPPTQSQPSNLSKVSINDIGGASAGASIITTTTATTTLSSSNVNHSTTAAPQDNHHSLRSNQLAIGPDLRGYAPSTMIDTSHLVGAAEQLSIVPPTSVYGHIYPYGPPPFGYMPPPQPNPVIPISAVPPAPPNQASPSGINHQHSMTASSANRYNSAQHQPQQAHAAPDTSAMGLMQGGVQAPHQGPPFYYYYPSPLYFDQTGGAAAAAPPSMYHPQSFHPQFFAMPNPAYLPNAHAYNQHQPPSASQSDATVINQQQPQHPQPQVNVRTRDIDTTIE